MAEKVVKSVLEKNNGIRNENLLKNDGKYDLYKKELDIVIGKGYDFHDNENDIFRGKYKGGILKYTHGEESEYSQNIHSDYGVSNEDMVFYAQKGIKPSFKVNDYDGFKDYITYVFDTYGMEETYAGHLAGLLGVREGIENWAYDVIPNIKGKTAQDVINEIMQYSDVKYALRHDRVGIVRDINVAMALGGQVTTNINNYNGKDTKLGMISNTMYARTLFNAAGYNSLRRTKYITQDLDKLYGNNLSNVYSLSSLFKIDDEKGRIAEPDTNTYINELQEGNVFDYLWMVNPEFELPYGEYDWSVHPNYGVDNKYFGMNKINDTNEYVSTKEREVTHVNFDRQINKGIGSDTFKTYSEGQYINEGGVALNDAETSDGYNTSAFVDLQQDTLLGKTNKFLSSRKVKTMISRFHDSENTENSLIQSAVYDNFGISHGRNLLTKESYENGVPSSMINSYTNPYCRVWTNHHQYSKMKHLIRPFIVDESFMGIGDLQKDWDMFRTENGAKRLGTHSVLNKNGMVNITPVKNEVDIKNCMFSIENLAWRDVLTDRKGMYRMGDDGEMVPTVENVLSEEQRGPNGGRIMWFPPYDITFQETASAKWSENEFIGRGEPVFTYVNSTRSGTLEFTMLVDHPSIINYWMMNRENSEENEQALLRFFAGCEPLSPDEQTIEEVMNGEYKGGVKDPVEVVEEKDIVFYTFFPNNFSGVDMTSDDALAWVFGGHGNIDKKFHINGNDFFLGYEMGVNPLSVNNISFDELDVEEKWYVDEVFLLPEAEKVFLNLDGFKENAQITLDDVKNGTVETKFTIVGENNKTNALYMYAKDASVGIDVCETASEAYAKYRIDNIKTYSTQKEGDIPYEFLNDKQNIICRSKFGNKDNDVEYWVVKQGVSQEIFYYEFDSKRKFKKSPFTFGTNVEKDEFYVKFAGQTFEFKGKTAKAQADTFILKNSIVPNYVDKLTFELSGELHGYCYDDKSYHYYEIEKTTNDAALDAVIAILDEESNKNNEYIVQKYFTNHKFNSLDEMGNGSNYGVIQYFYTGKLQETGDAYENVQDFIARHDILEEATRIKEMTQEYIRLGSDGVAKYAISDDEEHRASISADINWDIKNPKWAYPIDKEKENEILKPMNYYDMLSFGLNSTLEMVKKEMKDESVTFTFGEVYAALKGEKECEYVLACERGILKTLMFLEGEELEQKVNEAKERIEYLKKVFNPKDGIKTLKINDVITKGTASIHGYEDKNKTLSNNRESTIKTFLKNFPIMKDVDMSNIDKDGQTTNVIMPVSDAYPTDVNDIKAKMGRHARVTIVVGENDVVQTNLEQTTEKSSTERDAQLMKNRRYDNEYMFFKLLEENDNIAYKRLVDKVKYFSPAFHSITPEGFNARLTFLQQCTRQGPTSTVADNASGTTASNLAFGRAPFCVLRLGDFLNTKIVISSVNITYPDSLWDLNPEGIGVQFMMAKISMQIHIIGGSDISAPIKRLQNAVSFNYYANTSVYDDRSDIAEYDNSSKTVRDTKQWFVQMNNS